MQALFEAKRDDYINSRCSLFSFILMHIDSQEVRVFRLVCIAQGQGLEGRIGRGSGRGLGKEGVEPWPGRAAGSEGPQ